MLKQKQNKKEKGWQNKNNFRIKKSKHIKNSELHMTWSYYHTLTDQKIIIIFCVWFLANYAKKNHK